MARRQTVELFRLDAVDNDEDSNRVPEWAVSLVIYNPLGAVVYVRFSDSAPSKANHDVAAPGESLFVYPLPLSARHLRAVADFPGAVPPDDLGIQAIVSVSEENQGTGAWSLAA